MTSFDLAQFVLIAPPTPPGDVFAIHFRADDKMLLTSKMNGHIQSSHFQVRLRESDREIAIIPQNEATEETHSKQKNGFALAEGVCSELRECKVPLPVRYEFEWVEEQGAYFGHPNLRYKFRAYPKRRLSRPRTKDLQHMLPTK